MPTAITNTTYTLPSFALPTEVTHADNVRNNTNTSGKYQIFLPNATFLDRSSIVMKHGDTVNVPVVNTDGQTIAFVQGSGGTASQQYPTPTNSTQTASGSTFSLYWPSSLSDSNFQSSGNNISFANDTQWVFVGLPYSSTNAGGYTGTGVVGGGTRAGYKFSGKVRISIVTGSIGFDASGTQTKTIAQGTSAVTIHGLGITGLNKVRATSTTNDATYFTSYSNKLYLSLWNSTGTGSPLASASHNKWREVRAPYGIQGYLHYGFIQDAAGATTSSANRDTISLNTSSLSAGTYRIYLNHHSLPGDDRHSVDSRLFYITLTVQGAADTTPSAFNVGPNNGVGNTPVQINTTVTTAPFTPSGYDTATQITVSGGAKYSIATGAFTNSASNISPGQAVRLQYTTGSQYNITNTMTVTIGGTVGTNTTTNAANWIVATMVQPTGSASGGPPVSGNFGMKLFNDNANTIFDSSSKRSGNFITAGTVSLASGATSGRLDCEDMTHNNGTDIGVLIEGPDFMNQQFLGSTLYTVTRFSAVPGTYPLGGFTIKNNTNRSQSNIKYLAIRY